MVHTFSYTEIQKNYNSGYPIKRDCFEQIQNYLMDNKHQSKICAVYGLRRTGKTTLLKQGLDILDKNQKEHSLFIECFQNKTDFVELINFIKLKAQENYKYFFIDEITYAEDFQRMANVLSDIFVDINGLKIIITGTDSLGLSLPKHDILYDRVEYVNTTYTSFAEYSKITGINSIDEFIKRGSTLNPDIFKTHKETKDFIETAIVNNIINSLKNSEGINRYPTVLTEKYTEEMLKNEIERMINRYSQVRTYRAITSQFKSGILGDAKELIIKNAENGSEIIAKLKYKETNEKIAEILGCGKKSGIEDSDIVKIYDLLKEIGVFIDIPVYNSYSKQEPDEPIEMFSHPGMFHSNIAFTLQELQNDSSWIEATESEKNAVIKKAYESAMGKIMENIIMSDIYHMLNYDEDIKTDDLFGENQERWYVSKISKNLDGEKCEADILIYDKEKRESYLFEVKHSEKYADEQSRHIENEKFLSFIEQNFGTIRGRAVLYNGDNNTTGIVPRIPANKFLTHMYEHYKNKDYSPDQSIKDVLNFNLQSKILIPDNEINPSKYLPGDYTAVDCIEYKGYNIIDFFDKETGSFTTSLDEISQIIEEDKLNQNLENNEHSVITNEDIEQDELEL